MRASRVAVLALSLLLAGSASAEELLTAMVTPGSLRPAMASRPLIALDAGHGGPKTGAIAGKLMEKDITRSVVTRLADKLRERGYRVLETRPGDEDVDLRERVLRANDAGAALFISIHCNSVADRYRKVVRGVETYFLSADATDEAARRLAEQENGGPIEAAAADGDDPLAAILLDLAVSAAHHDSARLASKLHAAVVDGSGFPDRGVRQAPFAVLNGAAMPAVLLELGFLSHPVEGAALADPVVQEKMADSLTDGIELFDTLLARRDEH